MIIGHIRQISMLEAHVQNKALSHAYLFSGPPHIGKTAVAEALMRRMFCVYSKKGNLVFCGSCEVCIAIDKQVYADAYVLDEEKCSSKDGNIGIAEVRDLKDKASRVSLYDSWKVFLIPRISRMSREAGNAFLKLLEEPPPKTLFILTADSGEEIMPTIVSRVWEIKYSLVSSEIIFQALQSNGIGKDEAEILAFLSFGCPGIALYRANESTENIKYEVARITSTLEESLFVPIMKRVAYAQRIGESSDEYAVWFMRISHILSLLIREKVGIRTVASNIIAHSSYTLPGLTFAARCILEERRVYLKPHANKKLIMEATLISAGRYLH